MEGTKPFYLTRRFWGAIIACAGNVLPMAGVGDIERINRAGEQRMNLLDAGLALFGTALAFYGGAVASKKMTLTK